eukprot:COSAG02_NODE_6677_length_3424_cov_7.159699_4_plen_59_part_00
MNRVEMESSLSSSCSETLGCDMHSEVAVGTTTGVGVTGRARGWAQARARREAKGTVRP